jgi:hypothetical protein
MEMGLMPDIMLLYITFGQANCMCVTLTLVSYFECTDMSSF